MKELTIRGEGLLDGASTLQQAIDRAALFVEWLTGLQESGWRLTGPVHDDCGFLTKGPPQLTVAYNNDHDD